MSSTVGVKRLCCPLFALLLLAACGDDEPSDGQDASMTADATSTADSGTQTGQDTGGGGQDATTTNRDGGTPSEDAGQEDTGVVTPPPCDPIAQTCTSSTAKCVIDSDGPAEVECVPGDPTDKALEESCEGGDCLPGLACINTSTSGAQCKQLCDRSTGSGCSGLTPESECLSGITGISSWGFCVGLAATCDALTQDPCATDEACQPFQHFDGSFDLRCREPGPGMQGDDCSTDRCARGLVCVNQNGQAQCRTVCDVDMDCPSGGMCSGTINGLGVKYCP